MNMEAATCATGPFSYKIYSCAGDASSESICRAICHQTDKMVTVCKQLLSKVAAVKSKMNDCIPRDMIVTNEPLSFTFAKILKNQV